MSASKVPDVLAGGIVLLESVLDPAIVFDGPEPTGEAPPVAVCWGYDGNPGGPHVAVQNWSQTDIGIPVGAQRRQESFEVVAAVFAETGDEDIPPRRAAAFAALATIEAAIRSAQLTAWGLTAPAQVEFRSGTLFQEPRGDGLRIRLPFIVAVSQVRI